MPSLVTLTGSISTIYLSGTNGRATRWDGTGTPWSDPDTTPFKLGNNDASGPRWVMTPPETTAILSGQPPFSLMSQRAEIQTSGQRTLTMAVQGYAESQADIPELLSVVRRAVNGAPPGGFGASIEVSYQGGVVSVSVLSGSVQEDFRFWNDEEHSHVIRMTLTLQCTIGTGTATTLISSGSVSNGIATSYAALVGDWRSSFGQPLVITMSSGDIAVAGTKLVYAATTETTNASSFSESLSTTSTSGVTATATLLIAIPASRRIRLLARITSPSSILQVRAVFRLESSAGAVVATGTWISPGTNTTMVDLGYVTVSRELAARAGNVFVQIQYRSTSGASTSGTLAEIVLLGYYTFAKITSSATATSDALELRNTVFAFPGADQALILSGGTSGDPKEVCVISGQLPRAYEGASLWLAWLNGGVYDPADSITVAATYYPIWETIAAP